MGFCESGHGDVAASARKKAMPSLCAQQ